MNQPFFYFKHLNIWNVAGLMAYLFVSFYLFFYTNLQDLDPYLTFYSWGTALGLYLFGYKALRNMSFFLFWLAIAIAQLYFYFHIKDYPALKPNRLRTVNVANGLQYTIILLIVFQIMRFISLKIQHKEFIALSKGSGTDLYGERTVTNTDRLCFLIYVVVLVCLFMFWR